MNGRMKALSAVLAIVALIGLVGSGMTINDVLGAKSYYEQKDIESTANLNKLDDGLKTLQDNKQAYLDGKEAYEQGQKDLEEGKKTLADGYAQYEQGQKDYAEGQAKLAEGKATLDANKDAYEQGKKDYAAGVKQLAAGKETLDNGKAALERLKGLMKNISDLNAAYSTDSKESTSWRTGFEAVKAAGYVDKSGNLDKEAAKADKANLEKAIEAFQGVRGLEVNGAKSDQAKQMIAATVANQMKVEPEAALALVNEALENYENIVSAKEGVDELMAGYPEEKAAAAAEAGVIAAAKAGDAKQQAAAEAYETVKPVLAKTGDLGAACDAIVKAGAARTIQNDEESMAKITAGVKQQLAANGVTEETEGYADILKSKVAEQVDTQATAYLSSENGQAQVGQLKTAYTAVNDNITAQKNQILAAKDNYDVAVAVAAASNGKKTEEVDKAYKNYDNAVMIKGNYDRLQKPTADSGITHAEAVAAAASVAGADTDTVELAYNTVNAMDKSDDATDESKVAAAKTNIAKLNELSKDDGQIDTLNAGRKQIQGYLNEMLDGIAGNDAFSAYVSADEIKTLKALIGGSDAQFEAGADAFFKKAAQLAPLVDSVEKQVAEGQITYDEGVAALKAGKAKLKEYEDGMAAYKQGVKDLAAGAAKLADAEKQLADGEKSVAEGEQKLADGAAQLAEYEDGVAQVKDGLQQVVDTEADPGLESIAARLGAGFKYVDANGDLDIDQGFTALDSAWAYKTDDGDAIGDELYTRIYGSVAAILASVLALVAAFLGMKKKYKGALPCAGVSAVAAVVASVFAKKAGLYFSAAAGSAMGPFALYAGAVLAVVALVHAVADGAAAKAE